MTEYLGPTDEPPKSGTFVEHDDVLPTVTDEEIAQGEAFAESGTDYVEHEDGTTEVLDV